jgi:hypothetical protein
MPILSHQSAKSAGSRFRERVIVRAGDWPGLVVLKKWPARCIAPVLLAAPLCVGQAANSPNALPSAPQPQPPTHRASSSPLPCQIVEAGKAIGAVASAQAAMVAEGHPVEEDKAPDIERDKPADPVAPQTQPCPPPHINWYKRFTDGPQVKPLTPMEKGWLALRNLVDPFNLVTIFGDSGIAIASNSHSAYGPGWPGFAKNAGVSFTQDMTGEFFDTFAICSIARQDPHYHRMPHASIPKRIGHAAFQVLWTQGDNGKGMPNYANIVGFAIDDEISDLYVPGQATNLPSSAVRYGIGLATAPIDNFVTEFIPDLASHIHVQIVVIQRIIDQVAKTSSGGDTL